GEGRVGWSSPAVSLTKSKMALSALSKNMSYVNGFCTRDISSTPQLATWNQRRSATQIHCLPRLSLAARQDPVEARPLFIVERCVEFCKGRLQSFNRLPHCVDSLFDHREATCRGEGQFGGAGRLNDFCCFHGGGAKVVQCGPLSFVRPHGLLDTGDRPIH